MFLSVAKHSTCTGVGGGNLSVLCVVYFNLSPWRLSGQHRSTLDSSATFVVGGHICSSKWFDMALGQFHLASSTLCPSLPGYLSLSILALLCSSTTLDRSIVHVFSAFSCTKGFYICIYQSFLWRSVSFLHSFAFGSFCIWLLFKVHESDTVLDSAWLRPLHYKIHISHSQWFYCVPIFNATYLLISILLPHGKTQKSLLMSCLEFLSWWMVLPSVSNSSPVLYFAIMLTLMNVPSF